MILSGYIRSVNESLHTQDTVQQYRELPYTNKFLTVAWNCNESN